MSAPLNIGNRQVGARLCLVVSSATTLTRAETCYDLVENIVNGSIDGPLVVEIAYQPCGGNFAPKHYATLGGG